MWGSQGLFLLCFLVLAAGGIERVYRPGRRVCVLGAPRAAVSESFVQRVYQPFLTTCDGYRACSTYRTLYRTAYRRSPGPAAARPRYACCPGWKRTSGLPGACAAAICQPPCQNGGSCVQPGRCHCPAGWRGDTCQTDVDDCGAAGGGRPQRCISAAGGHWCPCREGHGPSARLPERGAPRVAPHPATGVDGEVKEEVQRLRSRVDVLEQVLWRLGPERPSSPVLWSRPSGGGGTRGLAPCWAGAAGDVWDPRTGGAGDTQGTRTRPSPPTSVPAGTECPAALPQGPWPTTPQQPPSAPASSPDPGSAWAVRPV
ncbi:epidermal growth factor-like protein 7 isoform X1 [Hippopotamus amphibius kiboko]|uniref:epidermal growth factor-like protein 7 isoform X1 n=1 Tax=Hippopotamus amphibius kiboko TaxID=575201 RepID=UPI002597E51B|nr:epidermal growth factor-like protein 7 isoform X1 [Hippopotamus amphibius kiboko]